MTTVTIKQEIDAQQFWSQVFGSAWESFGSHWMGEKWLEGDWETPGRVRLTLVDPDDEYEEKTISKTIDLSTLVAAYENAWNSKNVDFPFPHEGIDRSYLDLDDLDCIGGEGNTSVGLSSSLAFSCVYT